MNAYRLGLTGAALEYAVRKYKSHRAIPSEASRKQLEEEFDKLPAAKKAKVFNSGA